MRKTKSKTEATHTPEPWFVGEDTTYAPGTLCVFAHAQHKQPGAKGNVACICRVAPPEHTTEIDRKNAALIAAAPELLEALELALQGLDVATKKKLPEFIGFVLAADKARAAIAKAKGQQ